MRADHPDAAWVSLVIRDLTAWLEEPTTESTSQVTGGGAVRLAEERFAGMHADRPSLLVPSASYGMRAALLAAGVRPGSRVLIPGVDWASTLAAVRSIGAIPVVIPVDPATLTLDPSRAAEQFDESTSAAVMCHLHGVPADVPALRSLLGSTLPIIEDCAQALGSTLDGQPVGTLGDLAVFSFGPNKTIDVGEASMVTSRAFGLYERLVELTAHPARQILAGVAPPRIDEFSMRVGPTSAIRLAIALGRWQPKEARDRHAQLREMVGPFQGLTVIGADARRANAAAALPIRCDAALARQLPVSTTPSGALDIRRLVDGLIEMSPVTLAELMPALAGAQFSRVISSAGRKGNTAAPSVTSDYISGRDAPGSSVQLDLPEAADSRPNCRTST